MPECMESSGAYGNTKKELDDYTRTYLRETEYEVKLKVDHYGKIVTNGHMPGKDIVWLWRS